MIPQTSPPPNPLPGIALILAVAGAVLDWRYKRKGGKKPTKKDGLLFLTAFVLVGALLTIFYWLGGGSTGSGPEIIGYTVVPLTIVLFATWELGRWRVRRKYPLPTKADASPQLNTPMRCSTCGRDTDPSAKFCSNCGNALSGQAV
jgi:drug/metabolite transporter (DMT)-like permease